MKVIETTDGEVRNEEERDRKEIKRRVSVELVCSERQARLRIETSVAQS